MMTESSYTLIIKLLPHTIFGLGIPNHRPPMLYQRAPPARPAFTSLFLRFGYRREAQLAGARGVPTRTRG